MRCVDKLGAITLVSANLTRITWLFFDLWHKTAFLGWTRLYGSTVSGGQAGGYQIAEIVQAVQGKGRIQATVAFAEIAKYQRREEDRHCPQSGMID